MPKSTTKEKKTKKPTLKKADIERLQAERDEYLEGWQRAQADYKNLKARMGEDLVAARTKGVQEAVGELLPVIDNFESAYGVVPEHLADEPWVKGLEFIRQQFANYLQEQGIEEIQADGAFDPSLHEAVETVENDDVSPGEIVRVSRKGYVMDGSVLRAAGVVVAEEDSNDRTEAE